MISIKDIPNLKGVKPLAEFKIELTYSNGYVGIYDVHELLEYDVFKPLKNPELFNSVRKDHNAISWNEEIDLCADSLYLKLTGENLKDA